MAACLLWVETRCRECLWVIPSHRCRVAAVRIGANAGGGKSLRCGKIGIETRSGGVAAAGGMGARVLESKALALCVVAGSLEAPGVSSARETLGRSLLPSPSWISPGLPTIPAATTSPVISSGLLSSAEGAMAVRRPGRPTGLGLVGLMALRDWRARLKDSEAFGTCTGGAGDGARGGLVRNQSWRRVCVGVASEDGGTGAPVGWGLGAARGASGMNELGVVVEVPSCFGARVHAQFGMVARHVLHVRCLA